MFEILCTMIILYIVLAVACTVKAIRMGKKEEDNE